MTNKACPVIPDIKPNPYIVTKTQIKCKFCKSPNVVKRGMRKVQYYTCKDCKRTFAFNCSWVRHRFQKDAIGNAIQMFYDGVATNTIDEQLNNIYGVKPDSSNIWRWVQKYTKRALDYLYQYQVSTSGIWIVDETVVKINGVNHWFWDVIDQDTRFLVGTHLSKDRTIRDATVLFKKCKYRVKQKPKMIFSDKMKAYHKAINRVFYSRYADRQTEHITVRGLTTSAEKNIIERFHGTLKQRYKVMRGLKTTRSAKIILEGWSNIHYNFFKPHESIGDVPPIYKTDYEPTFSNWVELIDKMEDVRDNPVVISNIPHWGDLEAL